MTTTPRILTLAGFAASIIGAFSSTIVTAQPVRAINANAARVIEHWTPERRAQAIPRDLVIDPRGLGYLRRPDGSLEPYGHNIAAQAAPVPRAKPGGGSGDITGPTIDDPNPAGGTIGSSDYTFSARVTDASGVRSVTFRIQKVGFASQSFSASKDANSDTWSVALTGFTNGDWDWWIDAKDNAARGGNSSTRGPIRFIVDTGSSGGGGGGDTVANLQWTKGGTVQTAAGRVYFEMPGNHKRTKWWGYVCSGTVATDDTTGRSVILTAAHCVYDDANKAFARNVMFIPNQAGSSAGTDRNCSNDPLGCWVPSFGVVDVNWTTRTFPSNVAWDYAYYVVSDSGAHQGNGSQTILDSPLAAGSLWINFNLPQVDDGTAGATTPDFTYALGYAYSEDPKFMYCAEDMTPEPSDPAANWWLPSCGLGGGSSGGPWLQGPLTSTSIGDRDIISVNSWGYTNSPGMAGPKLVGTSASCLFTKAKTTPVTASPYPEGEGVTVTPSVCP